MQNTWPVSLKKVEEFITATKTWCGNTFSLNTHNHDTKYDSKGSASAVQTNLNTHDSNTTKHITATERSNWNNKANASHTHIPSSIGAIGFPNYSDKQSLGTLTSYTCNQACWIGLYNYSDHTVIDVYVNGVFLYKEGGEEYQTTASLIPLVSGDTISTSVAIQYDFYPMR